MGVVWGQGSLRKRRPGVFEIRIAVGVDPVSGRTVQRSFWFHGALEDAEERRSELAKQFAEYRGVRRAASFLTVGELLERWMAAHHDWRPSTWSSARSNVKALTAWCDPWGLICEPPPLPVAGPSQLLPSRRWQTPPT